MKMALIQEPIRIRVRNTEALFTHSRILMLRAQRAEIMETKVERAQRTVDQLELSLKKARLELQSAQGEAEAFECQERQTIREFFAQVRRSNPQIKTIQERNGDGVSFLFDSNDREVWVVALFSSEAPPLLTEDTDFPGEPYAPPTDPDDTDSVPDEWDA